jgi:hypothetical protein
MSRSSRKKTGPDDLSKALTEYYGAFSDANLRTEFARRTNQPTAGFLREKMIAFLVLLAHQDMVAGQRCTLIFMYTNVEWCIVAGGHSAATHAHHSGNEPSPLAHAPSAEFRPSSSHDRDSSAAAQPHTTTRHTTSHKRKVGERAHQPEPNNSNKRSRKDSRNGALIEADRDEQKVKAEREKEAEVERTATVKAEDKEKDKTEPRSKSSGAKAKVKEESAAKSEAKAKDRDKEQTREQVRDREQPAAVKKEGKLQRKRKSEDEMDEDFVPDEQAVKEESQTKSKAKAKDKAQPTSGSKSQGLLDF